MANAVDRLLDKIYGVKDHVTPVANITYDSSTSTNDLSKLYSYYSGNSDGFWDSVGNKLFGTGLTNSQKASNAFAAAEAQKTRDWQTVLANTAHQREVADMQAAGINPALVYGSGASGAPTPSGATASPVSADNGLSFQDIVSMLTLPMQLSQMAANVANTRASTSNIVADTAGKSLDNAFRERTLETRIRGAELANNLTDAEIGQINDNRDLIRENINKVINETHNEAMKSFLIDAQTSLASAQANQIASLLPYQQLLMSAQTVNQQAAATSSFLNALYQKRLMDKGMIEATIDSVWKHSQAAVTSANAAKKQAETSASIADSQIAANNASARASNSAAALQEYKNMVFRGESFSTDGNLESLGSFLNELTQGFSAFTTSIGGPLAGILR